MNLVKLLVAIVSFFALLFAAGCGEDPQPTRIPGDIDLTHLLQSWVNSYEEEPQTPTESVRLYRPSGFKEFPRSWFRMQYIFKADGTCEWLYLHPLDAHYMMRGTWETDPRDGKVVLIFDTNGTIVRTFKIIAIEEELLRIEML